MNENKKLSFEEDNVAMEDGSDTLELNTPENTKSKSNRTSRTLSLIFSFALPTLAFGIVWGINGITWNGEVTPLVYDMVGQYMPFMASLRYLISGEYSFLYNWNICLGGNFIPLFAYYLASPLNWLTVFFELSEMSNAIYLLTLLKIGLCGLSFSIYTIYGIGRKRSPWSSILFATCYALMSYNIAYSMCLMWLDGVILLPIILLGIEKIVEGKRGILYFLSIWLVFVSNFYISYMVGIFAALYIVTRVFIECNKSSVKKYFFVLVRFGLNTVLALCCSMFLLLPTLKSYFLGVSDALDKETLSPLAYSFGPLQLIKKILPQQYDSIDFGGLPSIYCGTIIVALALIFLLQKRKWREKISAIVILAIIVSGFLVQKIDFAWHAFQYPHAYPYRYAFLFSITILIMAYSAVEKIEMPGKYSLLVVSIAAAYTVFELFMNASVLINGVNKEVVYSVKNELDRNEALMEPLVEEIKKNNDFSRVGKEQYVFSINDNFMYGIVGADSFTSTFNSEVSAFYKAMGDNHSNRLNSTEAFSVLTDSILGVGYKLTTRELPEPFELVKTSNWGALIYRLYKNDDAFSPCFMAKNKDACSDIELDKDIYNNQNAIVNFLSSQAKSMFEEIEYAADEKNVHNDVTVTVENLEMDDIYLYLDAAHDYNSENYSEIIRKKIDLYVDGTLVQESTVESLFHCLHLTFDNDENRKHSIHIVGPEETYFIDLKIYSMNNENYRQFIEEMKEGQLEIREQTGRSIKGQIDAKEDGLMCTTIPCDKGLVVSVDNRIIDEIDYKKFGPFLAVEMAEGRHEVEISFIPEGLKAGCFISILGWLTFLGYILLINCSLFVQKKLVIR